MSLNDTPSANRIHIGFFGRRNAGKSSLVNAVTAQDLAVVSDRPGTTTDRAEGDGAAAARTRGHDRHAGL